MTGKIYDLCTIALSANRAIAEQSAFTMKGSEYIAERRFVFSSGFGFASSPENWFKISRKRGMNRVMLFLPTAVQDRNLLGFVNTSRAFLAIIRDDGSVLCMIPQWSWLKDKIAWRVIYRESGWDQSPDALPVLTDETAELKNVLTEIRELALAINEPFFANCFQDAYNLLDDKEPDYKNVLFHDLPPRCECILNAVSRADVFGAMGSWNDSPPYEARAIGKKEDYDRLSEALLHLIRVNLMYAINSCYSAD